MTSPTTTEKDLLAAIYAAPDDDGPRLVYGDWLVEQGNPRGELVQVQSRLAMPSTTPADRRKLRTAENKLLKAQMPEIVAPIIAIGERHRTLYKKSIEEAFWVTVASQVKAELVRGFIDFVRVPATLLFYIDQLFEIAPLLTRLEIVPEPPVSLPPAIEWEAFASSRHFQKLRSLRININCTGDSGARKLAGCAPLSNLVELEVAGSRSWEGSGVAPEHELTLQGARALAASPHLTKLKKLTLEDSHLRSDGVEALLSGSLDLEELNVANNVCDAEVFTRIARSPKAPSLRRLTLRNTDYDAAPLKEFASSPNLAKLEFLDLEKCDLGPKGIDAFLDAFSLPSLTDLIVASNSLGDAGGTSLGKSEKLKNLQFLDVTKNRLGKKAIAAIASSPHLANLKKLLINDRESEDARNSLLKSETLKETQIYYRGHLLSRDTSSTKKEKKKRAESDD
jgi:uncharacterized protein (TIGR02996 family)